MTSMKKLIDIIKIPALHETYQLELDFRTERRNLKRYLKSLKELKSRAKYAHQYFANSYKNSTQLVQDHWGIKKKFSQIDYFLLNGMKVFNVINNETLKIENFYESIHARAKELIDKAVKYLDQSKQSFVRASNEHEKTIKDYAEKCFPDTTTILYFLGFSNIEKIQKVEDALKEQCLLKENQIYSTILNTYLDQMENLKGEILSISKEFYIGASQLIFNSNSELQKEISGYEINSEEIEIYFKETGGANTDRSDRSNKGDDHQEEI